MQTTFKQLAGIVVLAMGSQTIANASTVELFNNLDQSTIQAINLSSGQWAASQFSTAGLCPTGCALGDITLSLTAINTTAISTSNFSLSIYTDIGGAPGSALTGEFTTLSSSVSNFGYNDYTFQPDDTMNLADNTLYWVRLTSSTPSPLQISWELVPTSPGDKRSYNIFGTPVFNDTAHIMSVEATPSAVPLPGAFWLMGSALVGLFMQGRRRREA